MKNLFTILLLIIAYTSELTASELSVEQVVNALGSNTTRDELSFLASNSDEALAVLVKKLRVINPEVFDEDSAIDANSIWCLRALRYITAIKFYGNFPVGSQQGAGWQDSQKNETDMCPFFTTRMSSDRTELAPVVIQKEIIAKWQKLTEMKPKLGSRSTPVAVDFWYF